MGNILSKIIVFGLALAGGYYIGVVHHDYKIRSIMEEHKKYETTLIQEGLQEYDSQIQDLENKIKDLEITKSNLGERFKEIESEDRPELYKKTKLYDQIKTAKEKLSKKGSEVYGGLRDRIK